VAGVNGKALKAVSASLIVLIVASMLAVLAPATATAASPTTPASVGPENGNVSKRVKAIEVLINRVECLINRTLTLASQYNVTIPENLGKRLDVAKGLLANASSIAQEKPKKAMWLAIKAGRLVLPVYVYVVRHLPTDVKKEILARRVGAEVNATESAVKRLENVIKWIEDRVGNVPEPVQEKLSEAQKLLDQAKELLANGTNVKQAMALVIKARHELGTAYVMLRRGAGHAWHVAVAADMALRNVVMGTVKLAIGVNRTLTLIGNNQTSEAIAALTRLHNYANYLLTRVKAMTLHIKVPANTSPIMSNMTKVLQLSEEVLSEINASTAQAMMALKVGDVNTAITVLNTTLVGIKPAITELLKTARWAHGILLHVKIMLEHAGNCMRRWLRKHPVHHVHLPIVPSNIVALIKVLENRVRAAKTAYEKGKISCEAYARILKGVDAALHNILKTLNKLPEKVAKPLAEKVQHLIGTVEHELAQLKCKV